MNRRSQYQDSVPYFYLIVTRIVGFLISGAFLLFLVPEFISSLMYSPSYSESWIFLFYALSMCYGFGFLLSFWRMKSGAIIMISCSIAISIYAFIDSLRWDVLFVLLPLSIPGILYLIYIKLIR